MSSNLARPALLLLALALVLPSLGCSDDVMPVVAGFGANGTAPAANLVRLEGQPSANTVVVDVVIDGPTTSSDLYSFDFRLRLSDPTLVQYVADSATLGPALTLVGDQTGKALAAQNGDLVTVGATKVGGGAGNGIGAGERTVMSLTFRVLRPGVTTIAIAGSPDPNGRARLERRRDPDRAVRPGYRQHLGDVAGPAGFAFQPGLPN
jgi:hypothetical protein